MAQGIGERLDDDLFGVEDLVDDHAKPLSADLHDHNKGRLGGIAIALDLQDYIGHPQKQGNA